MDLDVTTMNEIIEYWKLNSERIVGWSAVLSPLTKIREEWSGNQRTISLVEPIYENYNINFDFSFQFAGTSKKAIKKEFDI